mmetsp:Transcript_31962/g.77567  ORF Transcript_31962/g.77567 Transcript_31962/m.77567 type:complete len:375 (+) Transcript_31962:287-1411(+)
MASRVEESCQSQLHLGVLQLALELLILADLAHRFHEVLLDHVVPLRTDGEHPGLGAHVAQVGRVEAIRQLDDRLVVDVSFLGDGRAVNLHDLHTPRLVWQRDLHLPIETARSHQRRIEHVRPIRRTDHLDLPQRIEAVELVEELHERALDLSVSGRALGEPPSSYRIDLVHEDDARLVVLGKPEHLSDQARALADVLVDDRGGHHLKEGGVDVVGDRTCEECLASARRTVEQHPLRRLDPHSLEELRVDQRQLDHLSELSDLLVEPSDGRVGHVAWVLVHHVVHRGVDLARERAHDGQRGHVERDAGALRQLALVDLISAADHISRPTGCLHDESLVIQLLEHLADDLPHALQRLEVILRLVVLLLQSLDVLTQ